MHATGKEAMSSNLYECDIDMRKMYHDDIYVSTENLEQSRTSARIHPVCLGRQDPEFGESTILVIRNGTLLPGYRPWSHELSDEMIPLPTNKLHTYSTTFSLGLMVA